MFGKKERKNKKSQRKIKNGMKNFIRTGLLSTILLLSLTACDNWLGVNITKKAQLERFQEQIIYYISPEMIVTEIHFNYADQRAPDIMGSIAITYFDPNDAKLKRRLISFSESPKDWKILQDRELKGKVSNEHIPGVSITDYNFSAIADIIDKAIHELTSRKLEDAGVRQFSIEFKGDPALPEYEFTVDGRPEGSPLTTVGSKSGIYYHEVRFTIDKAGDWTVNVDGKLKTKRSGL